MKKQFAEMGVRIRIRRKEMGLTQWQLAELVDISNNHMSSIESGNESPSLDLFTRICSALNTRPDYLLLGSISSNNVPQSVIENLQLCSETDIDLIKHITSYMAQKNSKNREVK